MKKLIFITYLISLSSFAAPCSLDGMPEVSWVAFKTMKKLGVGGKFDTLKTDGVKSAGSLMKLLKGQKITIDTNSVNTKNSSRDTKIEKHFFGVLAKSEIKGQIKAFSKKAITIDIFMNGKKQTIPMKYELKDGTLMASGHIDIMDFALGKGLAAINKACYALHEGKTWSHVEISFKQKLSNCSL